MWHDVTKVDIYEYVRSNPIVVRLVGAYGLIAVFLMGLGFLNFLKISHIWAISFGPLILAILFHKSIRYALQIFYPKFDVQKHEKFIKKYWETHTEPSVDIFLPYAGEELEVHEKVVEAAVKLNYTNYKIYMLDDSENIEHKLLAEKYGCQYLSRPNKGEWKKSGNLEFGYNNSIGKYVLILDADFIPTTESLREIIPYIDSDPDIGILQTPQYFEQSNEIHDKSPIEFGGGNIVEDFYRIILPSRDEFGAAMCVGTSAFYRREAIQKLNGTPKVHASEDLATGLLITQFGYKVKYLPLIISIGTSPDTFQGYFKQHQRWCSGNLVFFKYWPKAVLNPVARFIYLMNPFYYIGEAFSILFSFQFLVLLYFYPQNLSLKNTLYFIPYVILNLFVVPLSRVNKAKPGTKLAAINNSYTYLHTFISMITLNLPQWHPTGIKIKGLHKEFLSANTLGIIISSLFIILFIFVLSSRWYLLTNYNAYFVILWGVYTVVWHTIYITVVGRYILPIQLSELDSAYNKALLYFRTHLVLMLSVVFVLVACTSVYKTITASDQEKREAMKEIENPVVVEPIDEEHLFVPVVVSNTIQDQF